MQNDPVVRFTMDVRLHEWSAPGEAPTTPPANGQVRYGCLPRAEWLGNCRIHCLEETLSWSVTRSGSG